jgi:P-type Ca2+ transporter type 2C
MLNEIKPEERKKTLWHSLTAEEAIHLLSVTRDGLTEEEVLRRRKESGWNEITEVGKRHWSLILLHQFKSLLVLILAVAAAISLLTNHLVDVYIILAVIVINAGIGFFQEYRAENAIRSLRSLTIPKARVRRNGEAMVVDSRELVPGDIIILEEGDQIPADARIVISKNLRSVESALTGESVPVQKNAGTLPKDTLMSDQHNILRKSAFVVGGYAEAVVCKTGMQTAIGEIAGRLKSIRTTRSHFQKKIDELARQMAVMSLLSAALLFLVAWGFHAYEVEEMLLISIAALVSALPEGLPAVLSIVLAIGANRMAKRNTIVRDFHATETLGSITTIITDKTGTLTQNTLTVQKIYLPDSGEYTVSGEGWSPEGEILAKGRPVLLSESHSLGVLLEIAALSNNASVNKHPETGQYHLIGDPTEGALTALSSKGGAPMPGERVFVRKDDLPFSSELKLRASLLHSNDRQWAMVVGAPEQILEKSGWYAHGQNTAVLDEMHKTRLQEKMDEWAGEAMRVIALAYKPWGHRDELVEEELNELVFVGLVGMSDPPREEVKESIVLCRRAGIRVIMATGDHLKTALAIARQIGILKQSETQESFAMTERQLLHLEGDAFSEAVRRISVFARLSPHMKLKIAEELQRQGELVAMTGDGVNDAPALKKADVGIAMGIMGTDVARDAAKMVLADDNFSTIVHAIEEGRIVFNNARRTAFFMVTTNVAEIITLLTSVFAGMPIPLTATQILWLNLVTDGVGDISLATERGHGNELKEKPIPQKENILSWDILPFLLINAMIMTGLTMLTFRYFLPVSLEKARSGAFIIMAFSQLYNVFNMRTLRQSVFSIGIFSNRYVNIALLVSVIIQVLLIELPFFERLFRFDPINWQEFLALAGLASFVLWFGELYKWFRYRRPGSNQQG